MKRRTEIAVFGLVSAIFLVGMSLHAAWDFAHPRQWEYPGNDPHVYVWGVVVCWLVFIYIFGYVFFSERRTTHAARLATLLKRVETLIREKKLKEAGECLDECKTLTGYSEALLPRQFNIRRDQ